MKDSIQNAVVSGHGNALLYAGALGLLFSDIIPTPADAIYFNLMQKEKNKLEKKEITPKEYWKKEALLYYGLNPIWWSIVLGSLYLTKGDYNNKIKVGIAVISAGAVISVLNKNIMKDELGI